MADDHTFSQGIEERRRWFGAAWPERLHDKAVAGQFARRHGVETPALFALRERPDDLPDIDRCVYKPTYGECSRQVLLMDHGVEQFSRRPLTRAQIIETLRPRLYPDLTPRYVCEEYLADESGHRVPLDYKLFIFGGEHIAAVRVTIRESATQSAFRHYDDAFQPLPFDLKAKGDSDLVRSPPACWDDMKRQALRLAARLGIFVRVDMYATTRGPVFGEFTFFPDAGRGYTPEGDRYLGRAWQDRPDRLCRIS